MKRRLSLILISIIMIVCSSSEATAASVLPYRGLSLLTKNGSAFDIRTEAGQKLYGYDTLQGACAAGGIAYVTLIDRNVNKARIVKVRLSDLEVLRVSAPLPLYHANNITYNTRKNLLMATCCKGKKKRVVFVDPDTLGYVSQKNISLTKKIKNLPGSVIRKYKGFTAIAYNEDHDCYVGRLRDDNNVVIFDGNMEPIRYVKLRGKKTALLNQGMESVGDHIYDVRSFKGKKKYNMITIHTMSGKYVGKVKLPYGKAPGKELECLFHDGNTFYAGFYYTTSQKNDTKKNRVKRYNYLYKFK